MIGEQKSSMATLKGHSWFMIMCSWELGADDEAVQNFNKLYEYLNVLTDEKWRDKLNPNDFRLDLDSESIIALNLIGRRKFVIICQARSNKVLQELSKRVSLRAPVKVEIFPATTVHDLFKMLPNGE